jgi:hypothetical protein
VRHAFFGDYQSLEKEIPRSRRTAALLVGAYGHWETRLGGLAFSGLAATGFPELLAACSPGAAEVRSLGSPPFYECLGEVVGAAFGQDQVGVEQ